AAPPRRPRRHRAERRRNRRPLHAGSRPEANRSMVERSLESIEMRIPAIVSALLHALVLAAVVVNFDFFRRTPLMDPRPVMVDFEVIDKKAAAPTAGNPPPQPKEAPIARETTKAPPPKSADPPPAPEKPKPDLAEARPTPAPALEKPKPEVAKPAE